MMKKIAFLILALMIPVLGFAAAGETFPNDDIEIDWNDKAAMQRGARTFVNYCMSCHSAGYARYNRVGQDLGIPDDLVLDHLVFTSDKYGNKTKVGELMVSNMTAEFAEQAFGVVPPDLSLIARTRGVKWLYNYLRGFYLDENRPLGMNNTVFDNVAMPHVLVEMQGYQKAKTVTHKDHEGNESEIVVGFELLRPGTQSKAEYDQTVHDLVAFLDYLGEPYKQTRKNVGTGVIIFLLLLLILTYYLKKEYWKDIH